jgi:signal transduction histidine kinase/ActR/RegA family two-component response regulator
MMLKRAVEECFASGRRMVMKYEGEAADAGRVFEAILLPLAGEQIAVFIRDVTHDARVELHFRQAQKMEAVGQLAGGIAHDINNVFMIILGNLELIGAKHAGDAAPEIVAMRDASERGVALVRQLLAFGRRQILHPRIINLNEAILKTTGLLKRLLGEKIHIETSLAAGSGQVRVDPVQFDQVIMNLAVNARDAMPGGGTLTFATENVTVGESGEFEGTAVPPGRYVALAIGDNGAGMSSEILPHIFEPFFTTKKSGKGAGLGLATVYGIVKQSRGQIIVHSDPQSGTTFRILLPRASADDTAPGDAARSNAANEVLEGNETILLVEDEEPIRKLCSTFLARNGYRVLSAGSGEEALGLLAQKPAPIDLLLTDVVMPGIHGGELARRIVRQNPGIRVLFMSGHPDVTVEQAGIDAAGTNYLGKPFRSTDLIRKVRTLLDAPAA